MKRNPANNMGFSFLNNVKSIGRDLLKKIVRFDSNYYLRIIKSTHIVI